MTLPIARNLTALAAVLAAALGFTPAAAQQQPLQPSRVPVLVAVVDALPHSGSAFLIERHRNRNPGDVILIGPDATAHDLSEAIHALVLIRRHAGAQVTSSGTMRVRPAGNVRRRSPLPWAARVIADLKHAARRDVPGVGVVSAVEIWLPRQAGR